MGQIISFINLKGGVGKTTITINIAATLAKVFGKKVLLIDLDPQTNATVSLISQKEWIYRDSDLKQTLYYMFNDLLTGENNFSIDKAIIQNVGGVNNLDLLPSSLGLVEIQDDIPDVDRKAYINHVDILQHNLKPILEEDYYDYILIDCPPNLGAITLNGISISNAYIIPTVPDILSKIGISLVMNRIDKFKSKRHSCRIELAGLIFTKVDYRTNLHQSTMSELRSSFKFTNKVFDAELPQRISIAEAPIDSKPFITSETARNKNDWRATQDIINNITKEFILRVSGCTHVV